MLTYLTAGESHGPQLTAIIDGLPAGLKIDLDLLNYQLARRQQGYGRGRRMRIEADAAQLVGGTRHGVTLGGPVALVIENKDWVNWASAMHPTRPSAKLSLKQRRLALETSCPRPGHADLAGGIKYGQHDLRNVLERASARETAARVAVGSLARQFLEHFGIRLASHVRRIGPAALPAGFRLPPIDQIINTSEHSSVRCLHRETDRKMAAAIRAAAQAGDTLGGIAEVLADGLPVGLGSSSQAQRRLDGRLAGALMSLPSVKGVEIGPAFDNSRRRGSQVHDEIFYKPGAQSRSKGFIRRTNRAGGLEGGLSNGELLILRVAAKPISTLPHALRSVDVKTKRPAKAMVERSDVCVVPALGVVCEAVVALVLADAFLEKFGGDSVAEIDRRWQDYLVAQY